MPPLAAREAMLPAKDAFMKTLDEIRANSTNTRVLDATYQLEVLSAAFWPDDKALASRTRWSEYGLTPLECRIADLLYRNMGRPVSEDQFFSYAYFHRPDGDIPQPKMLAVKVCHMRRKMKNSPYRITNVWGLGYRMELRA